MTHEDYEIAYDDICATYQPLQDALYPVYLASRSEAIAKHLNWRESYLEQAWDCVDANLFIRYLFQISALRQSINAQLDALTAEYRATATT